MRAIGVMAAAAAAVAIGAAAPGAAIASQGPVSTGHSGWNWGSPTPQGQSLDGVAFHGATGYAVGAFGTVLRSSDGGQTWAGLASGTTDDLVSVQELSPTSVVVAGDCTVSESTDSGATFTALDLGLGTGCANQVAGVAFSTPAQGYVELSDGSIVTTSDGGQTLEARTSVPVGAGGATGLAFDSPTTGVAVTSSGAIERTTDGAGSWTQVAAGAQPFNGVTFVTPTIAYAVGENGELLRSGDGGVSWTQQPLRLSGGGTAPNLDAISCASADPNQCLISTDTRQVVSTTDGGATASLVTVADQVIGGVGFSAGTDVVAVGDQGTTVLSSDGGQTFEPVSTDTLPDFSGYGGPIAGGAPGTAYMPGDRGRIAATDNGGTSWSSLQVPTGSGIDSVAFPSPDTGYALTSSGTLMATDDGGVSWHSFATGHAPQSVLVAPSPGVTLLIGPHGVHRSTDGGAQFSRVGGRTTGSHRVSVESLTLYFATAAGGRVVAWGRGGIVVSTDGGRRWRRVPTPVPGMVPADVSLAGGDRLWMLSYSGELFATSDGGRHWHAVLGIGGIGRPESVSFANRRDGLLTIDDRGPSGPLGDVAVLSTHDGGATWQPQLIAGPTDGLGSALATPSADYYAGVYGPRDGSEAPPHLGVFASTDGGASASPGRLSISVRHRQITTAALVHAGDSLVVRGHVSPASSGDGQVAVSYTTGNGHWQMSLARVASSGYFRVRLSRVHSSIAIVAQSVGDATIGGAGTPALRVTVRR